MKLPKSATSFSINLVGLFSMLCTLYIISNYYASISSSYKLIAVSLSVALPIVILEYFFIRPPLLKNGIKLNSNNWSRIGTKLLGLYAIFGLVALVYWVPHEYRTSFFDPYWQLLKMGMPWVIVLSVPYFWLVDRRMDQPEDSYYKFGSALLGNSKLDKASILQLCLGWLVKLFFLPMMLVYLGNNINSITSAKYSFASVTSSFGSFYDYFWLLSFTVDLAVVAVGYMLTLRILDSHIRSTEPTLKGWVVAIICYQPISIGISRSYLAYNMDNYYWGHWLSGTGWIYVAWGSFLIVLLFIYSISSVAFGIRFSNLTHRGIITSGPYRYSKHPAYISKNLFWWLVNIPFISKSGDIVEIIRSCLLILLTNAIYWARAKTEESHLMSDPVYQEYASWVNKHGWFAKIKSVFN